MEQLNDLSVTDLRALLRSAEKRPTCWGCGQHEATDIHHRDGHHNNNAPSNLIPWCKRCHNEHHGISDNLTDMTLAARMFDDIQGKRIGMGNRIAAYRRLGYNPRYAEEMYQDLHALEKRAKRILEKLVVTEPIYDAYLSKIKGVGPSISVALISEIGDPGRFETISSLWAYCGLHVNEDGTAPKKRRGQKANWNQKLRMFLCGRLADSFIKQKDALGRQLYDKYKEYYRQRDGDTLSKGHIHNRAKRKVVKVFVSCLWLAWRRMKGMTVTEPYAMTLEGHSHLITPEDWAGEGWDKAWQPKLIEENFDLVRVASPQVKTTQGLRASPDVKSK